MTNNVRMKMKYLALFRFAIEVGAFLGSSRNAIGRKYYKRLQICWFEYSAEAFFLHFQFSAIDVKECRRLLLLHVCLGVLEDSVSRGRSLSLYQRPFNRIEDD